MKVEYIAPDGHRLRVFSTGYMDWGVELTGPDGGELYYSPCGLCSDSYGYTREDENDVALDEGVAWTSGEWSLVLPDLLDEYVECYGGES